MKYSLHYGKTLPEDIYEIKVNSEREAIKAHSDFPNAYILLLDYTKTLEDIVILCEGKLRLLVRNYADYELAVNLNIPFIMESYINNGFDLYNIPKLCVGIRISYPLFFDKDLLIQYPNIERRIVANNIYNGVEPDNTILCRGTWIRPEDISLYEEHIDVIEWNLNILNPEQEYALYRIYNQGYWKGDLGMLVYPKIDNFVINSAIDSSIAQARLTCKQKCMNGRECNICDRAFRIPKHLKERNSV